jgi:ribonuclease HII
MRKTVLSIIASSLMFTNIAMAEGDSNKTLTSQEVSNKATQVETERVKNSQAKLVQEALNSLSLSAKALADLNSNKIEDAKKDIELALGKLEAILALKDAPKLLPIENRMVVKKFLGTAKDVENSVEKVKKLLDSGKVQDARVLLSSLQSEIDLTVVSLPLISYPNALKLASKYLIEEKPEKAKKVLSLALSTFTEVKEIVPIPIINSLELVATASRIAKENREQALKHLEFASDELDKAEKLGYLSSSTTTYKQLHELIEGVEKEVKGPNKAEKIFQELTDKLKEFKEKILSFDEDNSTK